MSNDLLEMIDEQQRISPIRFEKREPKAVADDENISKSERVRRYLAQHPKARNVDIAEALSEFGVTAADVSNVKTKQRKKQPSASRAARSEAASSSGEAKDASPVTVDARIDVDLLEMAVEFVRRAGGMNEAQHVLNLVRRIRAL